MDIGAYVQIPNLESILDANGITIPRLRGLRLMSQEKPFTQTEIDEAMKNASLHAYEDVCESSPPFSWNPICHEYSYATDRRKKKYMIYGDDSWTSIGVRWDRLHGKKRKLMKMKGKQAAAKKKAELDMWNKYAGREDVLYIHARIGTGNWSDAHWKNFKKEPWFLDAVDNEFDSTYCDIYARIKPITRPE